MKEHLFQYITNNIKFDWSFNDIENKLGNDIYQGNVIPEYMHDNQDIAYFQTFSLKISTTTNFWKQFKYESEDVVDKVLQIQRFVREQTKYKLLSETLLVEHLLNKEMKLNDVLFLRMNSDQGADPHCDRRRACALNIGFENSNTCTTLIKESKSTENFYENLNDLHAFTMNNGEAYLVNVSYAHSVIPLYPNIKNKKRYIISVNLAK
jgi:hypothetical protein